MKKLAYKISLGLAAGALATLATAGSAFAAGANVKCVIRRNGAFSRNRCRVSIRRRFLRIQKNAARVSNFVLAGASTGDNKANANTGGDVKVTSGDATTTVVITNTIKQTN